MTEDAKLAEGALEQARDYDPEIPETCGHKGKGYKGGYHLTGRGVVYRCDGDSGWFNTSTQKYEDPPE